LVIGAIDPRVTCVVSQVPTISGYASYQRRISPDSIQRMNDMLIADRERVFAGAAPEARNVIPNEDRQPGVYTSPAAVTFLSKPESRPETWDNMVTIRSMERARDYEPAIYIERISPKPLLMVVADQDTVTLTDLALQAYNNALEPKRLVLISGEHWTSYVDQFEKASTVAREWFVEHLMT
ncbi:MAG: alpha/beta hydrolase, partial [Chloroflexota bacterium]